jgi:hypothetical protein
MAILVKDTAIAQGFNIPSHLDWNYLTLTLEELWQLSLRLSPPLLGQLKLSLKTFNKTENHGVIRILAMQEIYFSEKYQHFVTLRDVISEHSPKLDKREVMLFKVTLLFSFHFLFSSRFFLPTCNVMCRASLICMLNKFILMSWKRSGAGYFLKSGRQILQDSVCICFQDNLFLFWFCLFFLMTLLFLSLSLSLSLCRLFKLCCDLSVKNH